MASALSWTRLLGRRSGTLGTAFLLDVLGAVGNFVVDLLDFEREVKLLGVLGVFFEERVAFGFQIVAFFLPDSCYCQHVNGP
jgi:hypothetical protein